jgi:hypothetical protein
VNSEPAGYQRPAAVETRDGIFYARHERRLKPTEVCPARPLESLGRWVGDLLGDTRTRRLVEQELEPMLLSEDEMPTDPRPPSRPRRCLTAREPRPRTAGPASARLLSAGESDRTRWKVQRTTRRGSSGPEGSGRSGEEQAPPFEPDPELVTYLERGRKADAPAKFRKALDELSDREPR